MSFRPCQWHSQGGATAPSPQSPQKPINHSLKKSKSVQKLERGGGVHVTCSKLKLIKYVSTEENYDILEELDL